MHLTGEVHQLDERPANLSREGFGLAHKSFGSQSGPQFSPRRAIGGEYADTDIDCNMADHGGVVWQSDIARLVMRRASAPIAVGAGRAAHRWGRCIRIDDKSALNIDLDAARPGNGVVDLLRRNHSPRRLCLGHRLSHCTGGGTTTGGVAMLNGGRHMDAQRLAESGALCLLWMSQGKSVGFNDVLSCSRLTGEILLRAQNMSEAQLLSRWSVQVVAVQSLIRGCGGEVGTLAE